MEKLSVRERFRTGRPLTVVPDGGQNPEAMCRMVLLLAMDDSSSKSSGTAKVRLYAAAAAPARAAPNAGTRQSGLGMGVRLRISSGAIRAGMPRAINGIGSHRNLNSRQRLQESAPPRPALC